jgi:hypothetical protein
LMVTFVSHTLEWDLYLDTSWKVEWGKGIPKESEEDRRWEVWECEGWVCEGEPVGTSSTEYWEPEDEKKNPFLFSRPCDQTKGGRRGETTVRKGEQWGSTWKTRGIVEGTVGPSDDVDM